jgi:pimeloyl-ACP methyl ester carboxylesterase
VVEACKIGRLVLFGAMVGGIAALAYAARHPERVSHLVIVGGFAVGRLARNPPELVDVMSDIRSMDPGSGRH